MGSLAHGHAAPPAVKQAVTDVVVKLFSKQITPDEAVKELPPTPSRPRSKPHACGWERLGISNRLSLGFDDHDVR